MGESVVRVGVCAGEREIFLSNTMVSDHLHRVVRN